MENQQTQQSKKRNGKGLLMAGLVAGITAIAFTLIWFADASSAVESSPSAIAAQEKFQDKLMAAQEEFQEKIEDATKEAGQK